MQIWFGEFIDKCIIIKFVKPDLDIIFIYISNIFHNRFYTQVIDNGHIIKNFFWIDNKCNGLFCTNKPVIIVFYL